MEAFLSSSILVVFNLSTPRTILVVPILIWCRLTRYFRHWVATVAVTVEQVWGLSCSPWFATLLEWLEDHLEDHVEMAPRPSGLLDGLENGYIVFEQYLDCLRFISISYNTHYADLNMVKVDLVFPRSSGQHKGLEKPPEHHANMAPRS